MAEGLRPAFAGSHRRPPPLGRCGAAAGMVAGLVCGVATAPLLAGLGLGAAGLLLGAGVGRAFALLHGSAPGGEAVVGRRYYVIAHEETAPLARRLIETGARGRLQARPCVGSLPVRFQHPANGRVPGRG
ncbi:MAG: hypothetical protein M3203_06970 [Actinomycetota bacterium]|nr:hypothetical protein [Actinomycetota bacterium]